MLHIEGPYRQDTGKHEMRKGQVSGIEGIQVFATQNAWDVLDVQPIALSLRTGGCGPGKYGNLVVPNTFYGLSVKPLCLLHDLEYEVGETEQDKEDADINFLRNLLRYIRCHSKYRALRVLREYRAMTYYIAVDEAGTESFLKGE